MINSNKLNNLIKINILSNFFKISIEKINKYYNVSDYNFKLLNKIIVIFDSYGRILNKNLNINPITIYRVEYNILKKQDRINFYLLIYKHCIYFYKKYYKNIYNTKFYYSKYKDLNIYLYNITQYKYNYKYYKKYNIYTIYIYDNYLKIHQNIYLVNKINLLYYFCYILY